MYKLLGRRLRDNKWINKVEKYEECDYDIPLDKIDEILEERNRVRAGKDGTKLEEDKKDLASIEDTNTKVLDNTKALDKGNPKLNIIEYFEDDTEYVPRHIPAYVPTRINRQKTYDDMLKISPLNDDKIEWFAFSNIVNSEFTLRTRDISRIISNNVLNILSAIAFYIKPGVITLVANYLQANPETVDINEASNIDNSIFQRHDLKPLFVFFGLKSKDKLKAIISIIVSCRLRILDVQNNVHFKNYAEFERFMNDKFVKIIFKAS